MTKWSALRIKNLGSEDGKTRYLFRVNMDNEYLQAERRAAPKKRDLLDAQFKTGLAFVGLGLLRESEEGDSPEHDDVDEERMVADALAPVLLPIINGLGELDIEESTGT